jgi:hypothetical protein
VLVLAHAKMLLVLSCGSPHFKHENRFRQHCILKIPAKKQENSPCATTIWLCFVLTLVLTSLLSSGGFRRLSRYLIAHALQTLDQLALHLAAVPLMEELLSLFLLFLPCFHHVILDHEHIMAHCQRCSFTASPF